MEQAVTFRCVSLCFIFFTKEDRAMMMESRKRTILKTVTWRVIATLTTMTLVYFFTRKLTLSLGIGVLEVIIKMVIYFLHERLWLKISVGSYNG